MPDYGDVISGSTKRFCGRMLSDALALICNNEYGSLIHPSKRSGELLHLIQRIFIKYFDLTENKPK